MENKVDKTYWASDLPHPLAPSEEDANIFKRYLLDGETLMLGCTKRLIPFSTRMMDIDPWLEAPNVITQDWVTNSNDYTNIIIDGGLNFTKDLTDGILSMAQKHSKIFIARVFNYKLPIMRIADHFPKSDEFEIKPDETIIFQEYSFMIWRFLKE
jgi:hypothetical protein